VCEREGSFERERERVHLRESEGFGLCEKQKVRVYVRERAHS